ncbi:MAG: DinB family protein [Bacteroidota bacterium]
MTVEDIISRLEHNKAIFESLLSHVSKDQISWRPQPEKWSLLEIVCHIYDEEREDFRARVKNTLSQTKIVPIDPEDWVTSRRYSEHDYDEKLQAFLQEREQSVTWLRQLENPDWERYHDHNTFGRMTARLFLVNWLAHDYLHIRQINRYHYLYLQHNTQISLQYAGRW